MYWEKEPNTGNYTPIFAKHYFKDGGRTYSEMRENFDDLGETTDCAPYGSKYSLKEQSEPVTESFTGKEFDEIEGLFYFGARYYDPQLARWLTPDPAAQYFNPYSYAGGDPVNRRDANGERACTVDEALAELTPDSDGNFPDESSDPCEGKPTDYDVDGLSSSELLWLDDGYFLQNDYTQCRYWMTRSGFDCKVGGWYSRDEWDQIWVNQGKAKRYHDAGGMQGAGGYGGGSPGCGESGDAGPGNNGDGGYGEGP